MTRHRSRATGRRESGTFFGLPHAVMASESYRALSAHAVKLLCDLGSQYHGFNNGDLSATWKVMQPLGWKSRDTLERAKKELVRAGMIELTRQGGLHRCSLYALTWRPIDECKGKLDVKSTSVSSGLWKGKNGTSNTVAVSMRHGRRVNRAKSGRELTRQAC